jgi:endoglucanase
VFRPVPEEDDFGLDQHYFYDLSIDDVAIYDLPEDLPPRTRPSRRSVLGWTALTLAGCGAGVLGLRRYLGAREVGLLQAAEGAPVIPPVPAAATAPAIMPTPTSGPAPTMIVPTTADLDEWSIFQRRFLDGSGRIVDTGNGGVSHTEGQGWGMLLAVAFDDPTSFDTILNWTARTLRRPGDALHSWRYVPDKPDHVPDKNNATDGDTFIAWALWRAAHRWGRPDAALSAQAITRDILGKLVRHDGSRTILLPGINGFETANEFTLNPSYYCFPALQELQAAVPSPLWEPLRQGGLDLISRGRFGRWELPPDWLSLSRKNGSLSPARGWPPRFSFDAIRIPLYLSWARMMPPDLENSLRSFWAGNGSQMPAWTDLKTNLLAGYAASPGMVAVADLTATKPSTTLSADFPSVRASNDYYSAALTLLARLATLENRAN